MRRPHSRSGRRSRAAWAMAADAATCDGAAERAAAELEGFVMKETSGERERAELPGALSRPDRLKPVPAVLSLSSRRRLDGAPPRDARFPRRIREPQQQIAVAEPRRAEANEVTTAQF